MGDFLPEPLRFLEGFVFVVEFDLGDDESLVIPMKFVNLPRFPSEDVEVACFFDSGADTKLDEFLGLFGRDFVLELRAADPRGFAFDGEEGFVTSDADSHRASLVEAEVSLGVGFARVGFPPIFYQEFSFDLHGLPFSSAEAGEAIIHSLDRFFFLRDFVWRRSVESPCRDYGGAGEHGRCALDWEEFGVESSKCEVFHPGFYLELGFPDFFAGAGLAWAGFVALVDFSKPSLSFFSAGRTCATPSSARLITLAIAGLRPAASLLIRLCPFFDKSFRNSPA